MRTAALLGAALLVFQCWAVACGGGVPESDKFWTSRRSFRSLHSQRAVSCAKSLHKACKACTQKACTTCQDGWRLRKGSSICDCAPGYGMNATTNGWCEACKVGKWCPGWDAKLNPSNAALSCPNGLTTRIHKATSIGQCLAKAGFSRQVTKDSHGKIVTVSATPCAVGSWSAAGNGGNCTACAAGLTTAGPQSTDASACQAPPGSYMESGEVQLCKKGTYTDRLNTQSSCTACNEGVTTPGDGADGAAECKLALKGYYMLYPGVASQCSQGYYNDVDDSDATSCNRCPQGLSTSSKGADDAALCLAPPGSYMDTSELGRLCPVGSFTDSYNYQPSCTPCAQGATTAAEGAANATECKLALPGYRLVGVNQAEPCPAGFYSDDVQQADGACKQCQNGLTTEKPGATNAAMCGAPAGWELKEGDDTISQCRQGWFKPGFNLNQCQVCGVGLVTAGRGATSLSDCLVPPGWGIKALTPRPWSATAAVCNKNSYGSATPRSAAQIPTPWCTNCPANRFTLDYFGPDPAAAAGYPGVDSCLVAPGWGTVLDAEGVVLGAERCGLGYYNAGQNLLACQKCPDHMTTQGFGATSSKDCVLAN